MAVKKTNHPLSLQVVHSIFNILLTALFASEDRTVNANSDCILESLVRRYPVLSGLQPKIAECVEAVAESLRNGGSLFTCGNGGSAADADHIAAELMKGFRKRRPVGSASENALVRNCSESEASFLIEHLQEGLRAIALTGHPALSTAVSNDTSPDLVFAQQLYALGRKGDVLLGISTSGNARNVQLAGLTARATGMKVIGLTGRDGGRMNEYSDICVHVPADSTPEIQELHLPVYHAFCAMLENVFFSE